MVFMLALEKWTRQISYLDILWTVVRAESAEH